MNFESHIDLWRLEPEAGIQLLEKEVEHLAVCPRCRIEAKILANVGQIDIETLPQYESVALSMDQVRESMSIAMVEGTLADVSLQQATAPRAAPGEEGYVPTGPARYEFMGELGKGGMGEVHRVLDTALNRQVAMKVTAQRLRADRKSRARFVEEAQIAAQLQHPGIIPVHEIGILDDGRVYFTMKEVEGHTLLDVIRDLHRASSNGRWEDGVLGWSFRRVIEAFRRICETVGYAHSRGVCHRDLKPANIMVGAWGEVLVLDWGLSKVLGSVGRLGVTTAEPDSDVPSGRTVETARSDTDDTGLMTAVGTVAGTPSYMPPEQARGRIDDVGPWSDVYALGAVLYTILAGRPPYRRTASQDVLSQVIAGSPPPPHEAVGNPWDSDLAPVMPPIPPDLSVLCMKALSYEPAERHATAGALAAEVGRWLEGAGRREKALETLEAARPLRPRAGESRAQARTLRLRAAKLLAKTSSWEPEKAKAEGWRLEDEAEYLEAEADLQELRFTQAVRASLTHEPDLPEAHELLAGHYRELHAAAESRGDRAAAQRFEVLLHAHDAGTHADYLRGTGRLSLHTDVPAQVQILRYALDGRRLVALPVSRFLPTPIVDHDLPIGSYLLRVSAPGCAEVSHAVRIERDQHCDSRAPSRDGPTSVVGALQLPSESEISAGECFVPAGWFWSGGEVDTASSLPGRKTWLDSFVIQRDPVTVGEYLEFLNDLVARGDEELALTHAPRERAGRPGEVGTLLVAHEPGQGFSLQADAEGDRWDPSWPVWMVSWVGALAYASWMEKRTGLPWRLPWELEWEKAARGADGRRFPWGGFGDPAWACVQGWKSGRPSPSTVGSHPVDVSPYGVRGLAGGVCDWVLDPFTDAGPLVSLDGRFEPPPIQVDAPSVNRCVRGGSWCNPILWARTAMRHQRDGADRRWVIGFRLARSMSAHP